MLVGWEGLRSAELARLLGCSPTAARIRLHRARARLIAEHGAAWARHETTGPLPTFTHSGTSPNRDAEGGVRR